MLGDGPEPHTDRIAQPPLLQTGIGVVAPYDFALDRELWRGAPDDVSLYLTRMPYVPLAATVEMAIHDPEGGFFLWVTPENGVNTADLFEVALA